MTKMMPLKHAAVIVARNAMGERHMRRRAAHLRGRKQEKRPWRGLWARRLALCM